MTTSITPINNLADLSMARIFSFLPPFERVRAERVCRKWCDAVRAFGWIVFKTVALNREEGQRDHLELVNKYRALISRCAPHVRELRIPALGSGEYSMELEQWAMLRNLLHLRFDARVSSGAMRAVADNLPRLQSIHFSDIDRHSSAALNDLLRVNNASLQALRLPLDNPDALSLPALPSSLRLLHINDRASDLNFFSSIGERKRIRIDKLLELAASCCPQLAMLILPMDFYFEVNEQSLAKLVRFEKLFYLRLCFNAAKANLFDDLLAKIGGQLRALLLESVDSRALQLIAKHCPMLEHCYIHISYHSYTNTAEELLSALHSVFQFAHLRSVSIDYADTDDFRDDQPLRNQILAEINGLNAKGNLEYLYLSIWGLPVSAGFITNLIQQNPKLRKLACMIQHNNTLAELDELKTLLLSMDGPMELEFLMYCPPELEMGENGRVRIRRGHLPEISQPMLRQFWARAMDSVPDLGNLND